MTTPQITHIHQHGWTVLWRQKLSCMPRPHTHTDVEINIPLKSGPLRYLHSGRIVEVQAGNLAIFWAGIPHQLLSLGVGCEGIWITLPLPWVLQWEIPSPFPQRLLSGEFLLENSSVAETIELKRWVEDFESENAARRKVLLLEIQTRLHRLALNMPSAVLRHPSTATTGGEARIETITQHINTHYFENITVEEIADAVRLNPRYMMKLFRAHSGMSVWEYVVRMRISHAQRLLITTNEKITDIALESGFGSAAPFYASFKKFGGGKSPRAFRQAHR